MFGDGGDTSRLLAGIKILEEKSGKPENSEDVRKLCQYLSGKISTVKVLTNQLTHHLRAGDLGIFLIKCKVFKNGSWTTPADNFLLSDSWVILPSDNSNQDDS